MPKKKEEKVEEVVEEVVETNPKLKIEKVGVCKDEEGNPTKYVEGIVSKNGKRVTTLSGVTYSLE